MFLFYIFSAYIVFGRITRYLHPLFLHSSYFRTRESFPLVSFPFLFFSFRFVLFFLPTYVHHFHRCDNRFSFLSCVFPLSVCYARARARACETERKDARVSACVCFVSVNPYQIFFCDCVAIYMHSYVSYMYHYVCVFQSWLVTEKGRGGAGERARKKYLCIGVSVYFLPLFLCMYTLFDPSLFFCFFTYIHIYTYTCIQTYIHTYIRVYVYGCMYTYVRSYVHTRVVSQKYIKESVYVYIYMCIYIYNVYIVVSIHSRLILKLCGKRVFFFFLLSLNYYIFTHIHTYIHAYIYTYIQTYIHTSTHAYAFMYRICTKCLIEIFYIVNRKRRHSR